MGMKHVMVAAAALAALGGCGGGAESGKANDQGANAVASGTNAASGTGAGAGQQNALRAADGGERGSVTVTEGGGGLQLRVSAMGLPPGAHGAHLHAVGRCDPPDFASAGPHWNPANRQHGTENPNGPHLGDMPNLTVGADGRGTLDFVVQGGAMQSGAQALLDADGAAFVIHADADDNRTDPSGNSGGRIACAVIGGG